MEDEVITVNCYWCLEEKEKNPAAEVKQAVHEIFPFCSEEHKKVWGEKHLGRRPGVPRQHTIAECQKKIMEWRDKVAAERRVSVPGVEPEVDVQYEQAKAIFG